MTNPVHNPSQNHLIGLSGPAGCGKDTVASILEDEYGISRYALASPIKSGARAMFGLTVEHTDGALKEAPIDALGGVTPRRLMQTLGTEWGRRTVHDDVWLWLAAQYADQCPPPGLVVTDVRFDNEADFIRERGGTVWHIQRDRSDCARIDQPHASEAGVTVHNGDSIIGNTGTIEDLAEAVRRVWRTMITKHAMDLEIEDQRGWSKK